MGEIAIIVAWVVTVVVVVSTGVMLLRTWHKAEIALWRAQRQYRIAMTGRIPGYDDEMDRKEKEGVD